MSEGLVPNMALLGGDRIFKRWDLVGGLPVFRDITSKETLKPGPLLCLSP
jgi:hypothetical protein